MISSSKQYARNFATVCLNPASAREKRVIEEGKRRVRRDRLEAAAQRQKLKRLEREGIKKRKRQDRKDRRRWEQRIEEVDNRLEYEHGMHAEMNGKLEADLVVYKLVLRNHPDGEQMVKVVKEIEKESAERSRGRN
ncbi:hypothetical protein LTS18_010335 [Coniosporium uncinatum]|uniref:Uncharacterized protein n=1 Tax=Coniosporium uncinatum TaxID=93489 RepID=A0ACC3DWB3_9PEZI|nr:hypothetical protein LTS18_010335 [Coniosporium uncinatum]